VGGIACSAKNIRKTILLLKCGLKHICPSMEFPNRGVKKSMVYLGLYQMVYHNHKAGKITQEEFDEMKKDWEWEPNPEELSAVPIKCYVYVVSGKDNEGLAAVIIDSNNNLDFSDDAVFYPKSCAMDSTMMQYSEDEKHCVGYEVLQDGRVVARNLHGEVLERKLAELTGK